MFLFGFRRFIAPAVIKFFYYISLIGVALAGVGVVLYGFAEMESMGAAEAGKLIGAGIIGTPIAILFLRFSTEMWLVLFEMNERLGQIRDK